MRGRDWSDAPHVEDESQLLLIEKNYFDLLVESCNDASLTPHAATTLSLLPTVCSVLRNKIP